MLNSTRNKIFLNGDLGLSVGGSFSWSVLDGEMISVKAIQVGIGASLFGFPLGIGYSAVTIFGEMPFDVECDHIY